MNFSQNHYWCIDLATRDFQAIPIGSLIPPPYALPKCILRNNARRILFFCCSSYPSVYSVSHLSIFPYFSLQRYDKNVPTSTRYNIYTPNGLRKTPTQIDVCVRVLACERTRVCVCVVENASTYLSRRSETKPTTYGY